MCHKSLYFEKEEEFINRTILVNSRNIHLFVNPKFNVAKAQFLCFLFIADKTEPCSQNC